MSWNSEDVRESFEVKELPGPISRGNLALPTNPVHSRGVSEPHPGDDKGSVRPEAASHHGRAIIEICALMI